MKRADEQEEKTTGPNGRRFGHNLPIQGEFTSNIAAVDSPDGPCRVWKFKLLMVRSV
jgi:hypothetical protein